MPVEDVFSISGRGLWSRGALSAGVIKGRRGGDRGLRDGEDGVHGVEMFRKL